MKKQCPKIDFCYKVQEVLDKDLTFDELYARCIRETCEGCKERA